MKKNFLFLFAILLLSCSKMDKSKVTQNTAEPLNEATVVENAKYLNQNQLSDFVNQVKPIPIDFDHLKEPFGILKFNKVIAYDFDGDEEQYPSVINTKNKSFNPVVLRQMELNKEQIENLISLLTDSKTYGEGISACFRPHLGIVFYQDSELVYEVDVCLDCNYLNSTTEIPASKAKKTKLEDGSDFDLIGFSKTGKMNIIDFCKPLGLDYANYK